MGLGISHDRDFRVETETKKSREVARPLNPSHYSGKTWFIGDLLSPPEFHGKTSWAILTSANFDSRLPGMVHARHEQRIKYHLQCNLKWCDVHEQRVRCVISLWDLIYRIKFWKHLNFLEVSWILYQLRMNVIVRSKMDQFRNGVWSSRSCQFFQRNGLIRTDDLQSDIL